MSPTDLAGGERTRAVPPAVLAVLLALILAGLLLVHANQGAPDAARYRNLLMTRGDAGSEQLLSVPTDVRSILDANTILSGSAKAQASTEFMEFMSRRVSQSHLKLQSITPGAREDTPARVRTQAILHMTGNFSQLESLLEGLARGRELISVDYVHLKRDTEHNQGLIIELTVSRFWINPGVAS